MLRGNFSIISAAIFFLFFFNQSYVLWHSFRSTELLPNPAIVRLLG